MTTGAYTAEITNVVSKRGVPTTLRPEYGKEGRRGQDLALRPYCFGLLLFEA